ncbi:MAG: helicase, partial [Acutalibacter sp.]|nr:helicase [Acutalibacter sp.]
MLQFVLGRAGSGKTEYMRRVLSDRSLSGHDRDGDSRCMMIVPEQFSFETEKAMLRLAGPQRANTIGIYSFTRLAETVFRKEGGAAGRRLSDGGRRILMSAAIETCRDHLEVYKNAARTGRVTDLMLTAVDELKMCGLAPAQVTEAAGLPVPAGLSQKLRELGLVYAAYEALVGASYLDSRDDLTRLAQTLEGSGVFEGYTVAVDSFEGFTVQEMRVLGQLLRQADTVFVSLCTDGLGLDDCGLFALVDRTRYRLERLAGDLGIKVLPPVVLTGAHRYKNENLKLLETQLFCPDQAMTSQDHSGIEMFQARDVFEEAEYVAATIRRLAAGGMRYRDITVICRNPGQYYGSLDVALEKRGVPCFMSQPIRVDGEPVCRFLLGAFEVVQEGLDTGALL